MAVLVGRHQLTALSPGQETQLHLQLHPPRVRVLLSGRGITPGCQREGVPGAVASVGQRALVTEVYSPFLPPSVRGRLLLVAPPLQAHRGSGSASQPLHFPGLVGSPRSSASQGPAHLGSGPEPGSAQGRRGQGRPSTAAPATRQCQDKTSTGPRSRMPPTTFSQSEPVWCRSAPCGAVQCSGREGARESRQPASTCRPGCVHPQGPPQSLSGPGAGGAFPGSGRGQHCCVLCSGPVHVALVTGTLGLSGGPVWGEWAETTG